MNNFTIVQNKDFAKEIMKDITVINFTEQEAARMKQLLLEETSGAHLFSYINTVYRLIGANFKKPEKFLVIPFVDDKDRPHLNIQKLA